MTWNRNLFLKNIKTLRTMKKMTLKEVEEKCPSMYAGCLAKMNTNGNENKPTVDYVLDLAAVFGVSVDALLNVDFADYKEDDIYVNGLLEKLQLKVESGENIWQEISPEEMLAGKELDHETINTETIWEDGGYDDPYVKAIAYAMGGSIDDLIEFGDKASYDIYSIKEGRPPMLVYKEGSDGAKDKVYYDTVYNTGLSEVAGNAYRLDLDADHVLFLTKVSYKGRVSYELHLLSMTKLDVEWDYPSDEEERDPYCLLYTTEAVCNSCNDVISAKMERLYKSIHKSIHQPKISSTVMAKLNALL